MKQSVLITLSILMQLASLAICQRVAPGVNPNHYFHYFKMHDSDNNNKLDGCELIKSLIHWHADDDSVGHQEEQTTAPPRPEYTDQQLEDIVDSVLRMMDVNGDGFIDYAEYRMSGVEDNRRDDFPEGR
uniref:EF-hand domain-containing protein n=1 Tax=Anopheles farauti TaxID=69004 RepID=A0A182QEU0_9DIPT